MIGWIEYKAKKKLRKEKNALKKPFQTHSRSGA